jgi:hypothetical protein
MVVEKYAAFQEEWSRSKVGAAFRWMKRPNNTIVGICFGSTTEYSVAAYLRCVHVIDLNVLHRVQRSQASSAYLLDVAPQSAIGSKSRGLVGAISLEPLDQPTSFHSLMLEK